MVAVVKMLSANHWLSANQWLNSQAITAIPLKIIGYHSGVQQLGKTLIKAFYSKLGQVCKVCSDHDTRVDSLLSLYRKCGDTGLWITVCCVCCKACGPHCYSSGLETESPHWSYVEGFGIHGMIHKDRSWESNMKDEHQNKILTQHVHQMRITEVRHTLRCCTNRWLSEVEG